MGNCECDRRPAPGADEINPFDKSIKYTFDDEGSLGLERAAAAAGYGNNAGYSNSSSGLAGMQAAGEVNGVPPDIAVGDIVSLFEGKSKGKVRFFGKVGFSTGIFVGVELGTPTGMNDGSVKGHKYFVCEPSHGIFVRPHAVVKLESGKGRGNRPGGQARADNVYPNLFGQRSKPDARPSPNHQSIWSANQTDPSRTQQGAASLQTNNPYEQMSEQRPAAQSQAHPSPYSQGGVPPELQDPYARPSNQQSAGRGVPSELQDPYGRPPTNFHEVQSNDHTGDMPSHTNLEFPGSRDPANGNLEFPGARQEHAAPAQKTAVHRGFMYSDF